VFNSRVASDISDGATTRPTDERVVLLELPGPRRDRQLAELARTCTSHTHVALQRPRARPWRTAFLHAAGAFHGIVEVQLPEDDQEAFMQCASALAATGASWTWTSA
jgi:hypothetical protein